MELIPLYWKIKPLDSSLEFSLPSEGSDPLTNSEEFDFQQGDIIAVTATPEDGWWSGELLDEARRVPGRHIFPSNFVHLF